MTDSKAQYEKITSEAASTGKEGFEALIKSTNIWMKGSEDLFKTYMSFAQDTASKNSEAFKTLLSCKNLNELTEVQNKLAQESFDGFMAGATKLSELSVKLATEALEPINDQVSKTIRKATDAVAA
jgi:phasin family protein